MNDDKDESLNTPPSPASAQAAIEATPAGKDDGVGFGRPPKHSRFKPGQSGNPRGRPPGVKSLSDIVRKILGQKVTITANGRTRHAPRLEALLLRAAGEASRDLRALRMFLQLAERFGESPQTGAERETTTDEDIAILRRYLPDLDEAPPPPAAPGKKGDTDDDL